LNRWRSSSGRSCKSIVPTLARKPLAQIEKGNASLPLRQ
jgi:hypothetical protein